MLGQIFAVYNRKQNVQTQVFVQIYPHSPLGVKPFYIFIFNQTFKLNKPGAFVFSPRVHFQIYFVFFHNFIKSGVVVKVRMGQNYRINGSVVKGICFDSSLKTALFGPPSIKI